MSLVKCLHIVWSISISKKCFLVSSGNSEHVGEFLNMPTTHQTSFIIVQKRRQKSLLQVLHDITILQNWLKLFEILQKGTI